MKTMKFLKLFHVINPHLNQVHDNNLLSQFPRFDDNRTFHISLLSPSRRDLDKVKINSHSISVHFSSRCNLTIET